MFDIYVFDLDGTLVNSSQDVVYCLKKAFSLNNIELEYSDSELAGYVGPPLDIMLQRVKPDLNFDIVAKLVYDFREEYSKQKHCKSELYPLVKETLKRLHQDNKILAVATNKPIKFTNELLAKFGLKYFDAVYAIDCVADEILKKSKMLEMIIKKYECDNGRIVMVGDTQSDILAARENGIKSVYVSYGYGQLTQTESTDYIVDKIEQILSLGV